MSELQAILVESYAPNMPKVTIVTVVFNAKAHIEKTLLSVLGQTYPNLEYIVIDGGSTDGTIDIIKSYQSCLAYWHSEQDDGIYDAMNKGLAKAKGQWICFMNAGDEFYSNESILELLPLQSQDATIIYGGVEILYSDFSRIEWPGDPSKLWQGMQFCHQSALINVEYHLAHPYNTKNKIAADLEFMYKAYLKAQLFSRKEIIVARVITGGASESNRIKTIFASCDAICGLRFSPLIRLYYLGWVIGSMLGYLAKSILPRSVVRALILLK